MNVDDFYESYIDPQTILPYIYTERISEGSYKSDDQAYFDREKDILKTDKGSIEISENTLDILSAIYYTRTFDVSNSKVGDVFKIDYFFNNNLYSLELKYICNEKVKTPIGSVNCIKFAPRFISDQSFDEASNMYIWISNDANKIPVQAKADLGLGGVTIQLTSYKNLKYPFNANISNKK